MQAQITLKTRDVVVACHGYVEYRGTDAEPEFVGVNVGVNARLLDRGNPQ